MHFCSKLVVIKVFFVAVRKAVVSLQCNKDAVVQVVTFVKSSPTDDPHVLCGELLRCAPDTPPTEKWPVTMPAGGHGSEAPITRPVGLACRRPCNSGG